MCVLHCTLLHHRYELQQMVRQWEAAGGQKLAEQLQAEAVHNPNDLHRRISGQYSIVNNSSTAGLQAGALILQLA